MTDRLDEIETRWASTTSRPWRLVRKGNTIQSFAIEGVCSGISPKTRNGEAIAAAPDDIEWLIAEVRRLRSNRHDLVAWAYRREG